LSSRSRPVLTGVSSFGLTGTNVHVVLQETERSAVKASPAQGPYLLPVSATTPEALHVLANAFLGSLEDAGQNDSISDICYSAGDRRDHHEFRAAIVGDDQDGLRANLAAVASGENCEYVTSGRAGAGK